MKSHAESNRLMARAEKIIPGGVNSPVRAFAGVGGSPVFLARGQGARVWDVDGNEYLDCVGSWGPLILGHARKEVVEAACEAAHRGTTFGAPCAQEVALAQAITSALPSVEQVRLVNSGTEAVMTAVRLARAFTGRPKVVTFEGGYHGHSDGLLARAGSGLATLGLPVCPGVPANWAADTLVVPYNDLAAVHSLLETRGREIACVLVEPVAGNMGVVLPQEGFLEELRRATLESGSLLIFDEVITGFRVHHGGAQTRYGISPDLTVLGKIIGGGFPIGAVGGRREIMQMLSPCGPVYQAGTLSGNPVACAAGLTTLKLLAAEDPYPQLENRGRVLAERIRQDASRAGVPVVVNQLASMLTVFFHGGKVTDYQTASTADKGSYAEFFHALLAGGVYLPPSQWEAMFLSAAHTDDDIQLIGQAVDQAFQDLAAHRQP